MVRTQLVAHTACLAAVPALCQDCILRLRCLKQEPPCCSVLVVADLIFGLQNKDKPASALLLQTLERPVDVLPLNQVPPQHALQMVGLQLRQRPHRPSTFSCTLAAALFLQARA